MMADGTLYEVLLELDADDWEHEEVASRFSIGAANRTPYICEAETPAKTRYTSSGSTQCSRWCLLTFAREARKAGTTFVGLS